MEKIRVFGKPNPDSDYILDGNSSERYVINGGDWYLSWAVRLKKDNSLICCFFGPYSRVAALGFIASLDAGIIEY